MPSMSCIQRSGWTRRSMKSLHEPFLTVPPRRCCTVRLELIFESGRAVFDDLKAWEMNLGNGA